MSINYYETTRLLKKKSIQLLKDKIHVINTTPFESKEFDISYEQIETKKTVETKISFGLLVFVFFLFILGTFYFLGSYDNVSAVLFILAFFFLCIALLTKLKVITIKSYEGNIELYFTNKNKEDVIAFADTIISSTNRYLLNKFSKIDKDLPIDNQLINLNFLRDKELISNEIFEQLKDQLLGRENKKSIGYH
jgi:hypothetical protein